MAMYRQVSHTEPAQQSRSNANRVKGIGVGEFPPTLQLSASHLDQSQSIDNSEEMSYASEVAEPMTLNQSVASFKGYTLDQKLQEAKAYEDYIKAYQVDPWIREKFEILKSEIKNELLHKTKTQTRATGTIMMEISNFRDKYASKKSSYSDYAVRFYSDYAGIADLPSTDTGSGVIQRGRRIKKMLRDTDGSVADLERARKELRIIKGEARRVGEIWDSYMGKTQRGANINKEVLDGAKSAGKIAAKRVGGKAGEFVYETLAEGGQKASELYHDGKEISPWKVGSHVAKKIAIGEVAGHVTEKKLGIKIPGVKGAVSAVMGNAMEKGVDYGMYKTGLSDEKPNGSAVDYGKAALWGAAGDLLGKKKE